MKGRQRRHSLLVEIQAVKHIFVLIILCINNVAKSRTYPKITMLFLERSGGK